MGYMMLDSTLTSIASYLKMYERFKTLIMEENIKHEQKDTRTQKTFQIMESRIL
jgi:hypothetical protein